MNSEASTAAPAIYTVDAIVYGSWGWEQTNIDFFKIVKRSPKGMLTLQPLHSVKVSDGPLAMSGKASPGDVDASKPAIRRMVKSWSGKEEGCPYHNYSGGGWIRLYEGTPKGYSSYA